MNKLEFVSSLVETLAWPVVIFSGLLIFRHSLNGLFDRLGDIEAFGIKARLNREAQEVKEVLGDKAEEVGYSLGLTVTANDSPDLLAWSKEVEQFQADMINADGVIEKSLNDARAAVEMAWSALENLISTAPRVLHFADAEMDLPTRFRIKQLSAMGIFDTDMTGLFSRVERLRNAAVHRSGYQGFGPIFIDIVLDAGAIIETAVHQRLVAYTG